MNWNTLGLYRCRQCNPDPGPPHDSQSPQQRACSLRYAAARRSLRHRCTECGRKYRDHYVMSGPWRLPPEDQALYEILKDVSLCPDCVGDDPFDHGWMGMTLGYA
ncbi:hypothetical protein [Mycolicibacterium canariasense]|nr:hypothetical protein [Mycolicibacterium canariasense]MCV7208377.1 hypothetical protein [Mycolicibacterium canariasense]